jgi:metallo-beta-lactamase class B
MQEIVKQLLGSSMIKKIGLAIFVMGVLALVPSALNALQRGGQAPAQGRGGGAAAQGRGGGAPDQSLPLVQQAFKITDDRYLISFSRYCMLNGPNTANGKGEAATPSQLFDNFYYVGRTDVGAWVLRTSDGLVLFDTLYNPQEAANIIEGGMRKLGLDPAQIKLVVLTHSHNDHSGGMPYFRSKGIRVMVGEPDWGALGGAPNPESIIQDRQVVTFGDTSITFLRIPGHTAGTIAAVFPVFDRGQRHMALLAGGIGPTGGVESHNTSIASIAHVAGFARQAGVDVFVDPHEAIIDSTAWGYIMRPEMRRPNQNDLIIGADRFQRFTQMLTTCMQARIVMFQQNAARGGGQ